MAADFMGKAIDQGTPVPPPSRFGAVEKRDDLALYFANGCEIAVDIHIDLSGNTHQDRVESAPAFAGVGAHGQIFATAASAAAKVSVTTRFKWAA